MLIGSILVGADELVKEMVRARIPSMRSGDFTDYTALGVVLHGKLVGGVVYHDYHIFDIQLSCAFDQVGWARRGVVRALFAYPFITLGCRRVTSVVGRKNHKAKKLLTDLGYKLEGVSPKNYDGVQDAFIYGMLREHCRWINGKEGTGTAAAA